MIQTKLFSIAKFLDTAKPFFHVYMQERIIIYII